ncbi:O1361 protein, partial [Polypterus senegalus]
MELDRNGINGTTGFILLGLIYSIQERHIIVPLQVIIFIVGLLANILIIMIVHSKDSLKNPKNMLIFHLCIADVCGLLTFSPYFITRFCLASPEPITLKWCLVQYYVLNVFNCIETWMITFMAIDRFFVICYPFDYQMKVSNHHINSFVVICWITAVIYPMFYVFPFSGHDSCYLVTSYSFLCTGASLEASVCVPSITIFPKYYRLLMLAIHLMGALLIVALSYIKIYRAAQHARLDESSKKAMNTVVTHGIVLFIFFANAYILFITGCLETSDAPSGSVLTVLRLTADLLYLNVPPTMNPIIYGIRNEDMKKEILRLLRANAKLIRPLVK